MASIREISQGVPSGLESFVVEELKDVVLDSMIGSNPLYDYLQFFSIKGNSESIRNASQANVASIPSAFRALDSSWTNSPTTVAYSTATLQVFGSRFQLDVAHARRGWDVPDLIVRELSRIGRQIGYEFINALFNANSSNPNNFAGLKQLNLASQRLFFTSDGTNAGNALVLDSSNSTTFFDLLDRAIEEVRPGNKVIVADMSVISRIKSLKQSSFNYVTNDSDDLGFPSVRTIFYEGIPIIAAGFNAAGSRVLSLNNAAGDEQYGAGTQNKTSLWVLSLGEAENVTIATNMGLQVLVDKTGIHFQAVVEMDAVPLVLDSDSVRRIVAIRLS